MTLRSVDHLSARDTIISQSNFETSSRGNWINKVQAVPFLPPLPRLLKLRLIDDLEISSGTRDTSWSCSPERLPFFDLKQSDSRARQWKCIVAPGVTLREDTQTDGSMFKFSNLPCMLEWPTLFRRKSKVHKLAIFNRFNCLGKSAKFEMHNSPKEAHDRESWK